MMFAWVLDLIMLGDGFFEMVAWECCFQGPIVFRKLVLATFLLRYLLGVVLLGALRQECKI